MAGTLRQNRQSHKQQQFYPNRDVHVAEWQPDIHSGDSQGRWEVQVSKFVDSGDDCHRADRGGQ
jgi:hypothetical protein